VTHRPDPRERINREELDRLFDRELDASERRDLVGRLAHDEDALDEVNDIRGIVNTMRLRPNELPDMTGAVLGRLDREQGFLSIRLRRRVKTGRLAVAACALLGLLGVAIAHRVAPDRFRLHEVSTPVADLGDAVRHDSIEGRRVLAAAVQELATVSARPPADGLGSPSVSAAVFGPDRSFASPTAVTVSLDLPASAPARFLVLTASADAEVVALGSDPAFTVPDALRALPPLDAVAFAERDAMVPSLGTPGFALAAVGAAPVKAPEPSGLAEIRAGVLPLSFPGMSRAAFVGRRSVFPERIDHARDASPAHPARR
jgi:hypothetical protein